jgi:formamidopyrimidine-DNA glycosylase
MPELPEVETVVRDLNRKVKGRTITGVWFDWPKAIKDVSKQSRLRVSQPAVTRFSKDIVGEKIIGAKRKGKNILIYLSSDKLLLIHQKMTGHLLIGKWKIAGKKVIPLEPKSVIDDPYNGYIHLILNLDDGRMIALSDLRKFAKAILGTRAQIEALPELTDLGPDALSAKLTSQRFTDIIRANGRTIKQVLLDPGVVAGIGNIYSDDMLWRAKIHPLRKPSSLSDSEIKQLYRAMREVLSKAVKLRGTSTSDFRDTAGKEGGYTEYRLVYQRENKPCNRCKTPIKRLKVGGRSAHYCPKCQVR